MTRSNTPYHSAAQDGRLDILKEATRKDCDASDEDGMTPVLWAAFKGRLEALRVLMGRGGNPDKTDVWGNTALHYAAANGHLPCVTFLVNFGANVWNLDNDFHSPLQLAALTDHRDIVAYLDEVCDTRAKLSKKAVQKMRQKAMEQAQKRCKKCDKRIQENARKAEKDHSLRKGVAQGSGGTTGRNGGTSSSLSIGMGGTTPGSTVVLRSPGRAKVTNPLAVGHATQRMKSYSEHFPDVNGAFIQGGGTTRSGAVAKKGAKKKIQEPHILYANPEDLASGRHSSQWDARSAYSSRAMSEPDLLADQWETETLRAPRESRPMTQMNGIDGDAGLFVRPGFGSVAFFHRPNLAESVTPTQWRDQDTSPSHRNGQSSRPRSEWEDNFSTNGTVIPTVTTSAASPPLSNSIGSTSSLERRVFQQQQHLSGGASAYDDLAGRGGIDTPDLAEEEEEAGDKTVQSMEVFLASNNLTQYAGRLAEEQLDLSALMLCSEDDLQSIGLALGPRRKLHDAIQRRKFTLDQPGPIQDSYL